MRTITCARASWSTSSMSRCATNCLIIRSSFSLSATTLVCAGARSSNWDQVDWDANLIRLEKKQTKAKKARNAPLYGELRAWFELAYSARDTKCPFIVSWKGHGITEVKTAWKKARERGCPCTAGSRFTAHGRPQHDSGGDLGKTRHGDQWPQDKQHVQALRHNR